MIRLPNPKSDIQEYIKIISVINTMVEQSGLTNFNFDDISNNLTRIGNISSQKAFGSKAIEASFRENKSLDAVFNQSKSLSEVLRLLGLIISVNNQHTFRITKFGKYVSSFISTSRDDYKNEILKLLSYSFLNINYRHPQIIANEDLSVKPFLAVLRILHLIENFITKDEFNYFILSLKNDNYESLKFTADEILLARKKKDLFQKYKIKILKSSGITENTANNYTRIPIAFFKSFNLLRKAKLSDVPELKAYLKDNNKFINGMKPSPNTEIYTIGDNGSIFMHDFPKKENIKFKDVEEEGKEVRFYIALKSLTDFYQTSLRAENYFSNKFPKRYEKEKLFFTFPYHILLSDEIEEFETYLDNLNSQCNMMLLYPYFSKNEEVEYYTWENKKVNIFASLNTNPLWKSKTAFSCVNCRPARCYEYSQEELICSEKTHQEIPDKNAVQVCPVNAISFNCNLFPELDYNKCVDCGICITRCKFGAINYVNGVLSISQQLSKRNLIVKRSTVSDAMMYFDGLKVELSYMLDNDVMIDILNKFFIKIQKLKKEEFYPLVRNLLRTLGLKAKTGKTGDTQWRYDAIVVEPFVMPAEIKSPSEDNFINPNSIRQAIENSITIEASHHLVKKAMSAVIALMYSNKRSASEDMLKDAHALHNIRILLISVIIIAYLNLKNLENRFTIKDIEFLFKNTIGSFDDIALKEFWINYLARREELEAINEQSEYFSIKGMIKNHNYKFQDKLKTEVDVFNRVFEIISAKK